VSQVQLCFSHVIDIYGPHVTEKKEKTQELSGGGSAAARATARSSLWLEAVAALGRARRGGRHQ
jgi:hypothetical protein